MVPGVTALSPARPVKPPSTSVTRPFRYGRLPTRQVVIADGPHPPVELVTVAATLEHGWSRRPCPPCARSIGIGRSLTDNNGRLQEGLTCGTGFASDVNGLPGRAFQALDRWATPGPHPGHERLDRSVTTGSAPAQLTGQIRPGIAGRLDPFPAP